ncbi:MAG: LacI family DNA-binding transcriptional regulator [Opitutaceae bacterium]|nr:LacI family DNA-binding transcriptional regulator [Opitutaceae bacterium]
MSTIAREAGVTASTVSRALRGDPRISERTRTKIKNLAERLRYKPNPLVSALMTQLRDGRPPAAKGNLVWLDYLADPMAWEKNPVQRAFYLGAQRRASALGHSLTRIPVMGRSADRLTRCLRNRGVSGVLLPYFPTAQGVASKLPIDLRRFTCVSVGTRYEQPLLHYSSDDQYESCRLAVQQLWNLGYRYIGYVGDPRVERIVNGRFFAGYHATLFSQFETQAPPPFIDLDEPKVVEWVRRFGIEAIVTANPRIYGILVSSGYQIPRDLGFAHLNIDDAHGIAGLPAGMIAGVRQDNEGVGANAVDLLVSLLYHNELGLPESARGMQVQSMWIKGASVRMLPAFR